jgi:hypothetical protein
MKKKNNHSTKKRYNNTRNYKKRRTQKLNKNVKNVKNIKNLNKKNTSRKMRKNSKILNKNTKYSKKKKYNYSNLYKVGGGFNNLNSQIGEDTLENVINRFITITKNLRHHETPLERATENNIESYPIVNLIKQYNDKDILKKN